nr:hypothetical protein BaRGS_010315 [Batillaria attramentaria]
MQMITELKGAAGGENLQTGSCAKKKRPELEVKDSGVKAQEHNEGLWGWDDDYILSDLNPEANEFIPAERPDTVQSCG